mmetsp:Transcript_21117/g.59040  ORF Transcript_21117/g.59040 Transcript_21117/m.59040 type:complete len:238 (-) Transcript_21117:260-973(-)
MYSPRHTAQLAPSSDNKRFEKCTIGRDAIWSAVAPSTFGGSGPSVTSELSKMKRKQTRATMARATAWKITATVILYIPGQASQWPALTTHTMPKTNQPYKKTDTFLLHRHAGHAVKLVTQASKLPPTPSAACIFERKTKRTGICTTCSNVCMSSHHLSGRSQPPQRLQNMQRKSAHVVHTTTLPTPPNLITVLINRTAAVGSRRTTSTSGSSLCWPLGQNSESVASDNLLQKRLAGG